MKNCREFFAYKSNEKTKLFLLFLVFSIFSYFIISVQRASADDSPVGYWKLDETAAGSEVVDSSGNGNNGTPSGDPEPSTAIAPLKFANSRSLGFDGSDDKISINDSPSLDVSAKQISISAWVKTSTSQNDTIIVEKGGWTTGTYQLVLGDGNDKLTWPKFNLNNGCAPADSPASIDDGAWHHLLGMYDGAHLYIYVDGTLKGQSDCTNDIGSNGNPLTIGARYNQDGHALMGNIDDVRIFSRTLAASEIKELSARQLGYWKFENNGTDSSGSGNTATLQGTASYSDTVPAVSPPSTKSVYFHGGSKTDPVSYASLPHGILKDSNDFTFAGWVYLNALESWTRIFDFGNFVDGVHYEYMFLTPQTDNIANGLKPRYAINNDDGEQVIDSSLALTTGHWYHVAVTYDNAATTGTMYINGIEVGSNTNMTLKPSDLGDTQDDWLGDSQYVDDRTLNGLLDDVRLYNQALSSSEIQQLADITPPAISATTPTDDSANVAVNSNLVINFSKNVDVESGNIVIKKSSDNSTVETIDVTSAKVTGSGTDTITVDPSSNFNYETGYYVQIAATAFADAAGNSYAGISDTTSWNFTTVDRPTASTPYAWVPNVISNNVSKINTDTNSTSTVNVNTNPQGIAVDSSGYVWVANFNSNNVSKIDASTGAIEATINVGSHPQGVAIDLSGYVWVTNYSDGDVSKIDPSSNSVLKTVDVGSLPSLIAADSSGYIWVTNYGSSNVSKISTSTDSVEATIAVGTGPKCIAVDNSGFVWVANTSGDMSKIDPSTDLVVANVNAGVGTYGVTVDVSGYVWATDYVDNSVAKIDPASNSVVATINSFDGPAGIAADVFGNVWVANSNANSVLKVNSLTNEIIDTISVGSSPFAWGDFTGFALQRALGYSIPDLVSPVVSTLTPSDNATNVAVYSNLVINFSKNVDVESGNIVIKKSSDNSTVETIGVTGAQVTGSGTDTITINPSLDFEYNTGYYIQIAATAFDDAAGNSYAGISDTTTWNFTTRLPKLSGAPSFSAGTPAKFGTQLTVGAGTLNPSTNLTYHWYRSDTNIFNKESFELGTGATYTPVAADIGKYLVVVASSTDAGGTVSLASDNPVINAGNSASVYTTDGNASIVAPDGFSSGNVTLHIAKIDNASAPSAPNGIYMAGDNYFQLTATDDGDNPVDTFDQPITFTISYGTDIESRYVESTLDVYKNNNGTWVKKNCALDISANTLTCSLSSFSDYGVLGEEVVINPETTSSREAKVDLKLSRIGYRAVSPREIEISWRTNNNADEKVYYGTGKNLKDKKSNSQKGHSHVIHLTDLTPGTKYYFRASSADNENQSARSEIYSLTLADENQENSGGLSADATVSAYSGGAKPNVCAYTVEQGDTLWSIAKKVYGDATAYSLIIDSNKEKYPNIENKLSIGQELNFRDCSGISGVKGASDEKEIPGSAASDDPTSSDFDIKKPEAHWWNPFSWF